MRGAVGPRVRRGQAREAERCCCARSAAGARRAPCMRILSELASVQSTMRSHSVQTGLARPSGKMTEVLHAFSGVMMSYWSIRCFS